MNTEGIVVAVIDIGSNTINLLIAQKSDSGLEKSHFERIPAKLGKGGMEAGLLTEEAMSRGLKALDRHKVSCEIAQVQRVKVTATSAVRSAKNGHEFVKRVKEEIGFDVEVISGDREAELICKGVNLTGLLDDGPALIMDIGGGSTEFILSDEEQVFWLKSYDLGVTRLMERFKASDPFSEEEMKFMRNALSEDLEELWNVIERFPIKRLIGASGSFNSLSLMIAKGDKDRVHPVFEEISRTTYRELSARLRAETRNVRKAIPGLIEDRVETMPYSVLLLDLVLDKAKFSQVYRSSYALKEGLLSELL